MKYSDIKTMEDLDKAQKFVKRRLDAKGDSVRCSFYAMKDCYSPSNMMISGLRAVSSVIPFDRLLLAGVTWLKRRVLR